MKKISLLMLLFAIGMCSCKKAKDSQSAVEPSVKPFQKLQQAEWLIGRWGGTFPDGSKLTETWMHENDSTFSAKSYIVAGKDTVFAEYVSLEERAGDLNYVVTVLGQNQEEPVSFQLTSSTREQLTFENPKHDFPNKIVYQNFKNDSLVAQIHGIQNGKAKTESFPMKKLK